MLRRMLLPLLIAGGTSACGTSEPVTDTDVVPDEGGAPGPRKNRTLVVVFQRFAADWINMLVPAGDAAYANLRRSLRVDDPLPLDGFFGLHPALAALTDLYDAGDLAFVAATGWIPTEARDRSHFYAQSLAEAGARGGVSGGWLGRAMHRDAHNGGLWAALAAERAPPKSLLGFANAMAVRDFGDFTHGSIMGHAATALVETFGDLAGPPGEPVLRLARGMRELADSPPPTGEVAYPDSELGQGLRVAAQAIRGGLAPRVITVTSNDDWDTHVLQASRHATHLPRFAAALRAFHEDLGPAMEDVMLVTMTEFGRKAIENLGGTDHGTASSMLVMGKRVAGRRVYGDWPGLHASALYQGEDLEPTTDYRAVLGELLVRHLGLTETALDEVFPGGYAARGNWRGLIR